MSKIKILQVIGSLHVGGAENVAVNIYRYIDREKFEFHYLVYTKPDDVGEYESEVISLGGKVLHLEYTGNNKNFRKKLKNIIMDNGPYKIVHSHLMFHNGVILKTAYECGIEKRISHAHSTKDAIYEKCIDKIIHALYRSFMRINIKKFGTDWLACGKEAGIYLYGRQKYNSDVVLIKNGIYLEKFEYNTIIRDNIRYKYGINSNAFVIGNAAHFIPLKNHEFIVDVFEAVNKKIPDSYLFLMGDGPLKSKIEEKVKKMNLDDKVIFTGVTNRVNEIMQAVDVFLLPSLYEGLPVSVVEAQATGLECIVSDKVTKEVNFGDLVHFLPIDKGIELWVEQLLELRGYRRESGTELVREHGYSARENVKDIEGIYLN